MPLLASSDDCTACMACYNSCPNKAINVYNDGEGFLQLKVDAERCVDCKQCEKVCPVLSSFKSHESAEPKVYAAWYEEDRRVSSSGGLFSALARKTINKGGIVYGAAFDKSFQLQHIGVNNVNDLELLRGSKYVQSKIGDVYKTIKRQVIEGKTVLFCGTPCQVAGLHSFMKKTYENILTIDLVCHGVPSNLVFQSYLKKLVNRFDSTDRKRQIEKFEFRCRNGWGILPSISSFGNSYYLYGVDALYLDAFNKNALFRRSCYQCPFAKLPRVGDITLGDFWGIGRHGISFRHKVEKGVSMVMINTEQGLKAFNDLGNSIFREERSIEEALVENPNIINPSKKHPRRDEIIADFINDQLSLKEIDLKYQLVDRSWKNVVKTIALKMGFYDAIKVFYNKFKSI